MWQHYLGSQKTKVFVDNVSLKYLKHNHLGHHEIVALTWHLGANEHKIN